jgi:hypothetical protein
VSSKRSEPYLLAVLTILTILTILTTLTTPPLTPPLLVVVTVQGTRKPVWRAFEMLANLSSYRLPVTGFVSPADGNSTISVLATTDAAIAATTGLTLLVSNYRRAGHVTLLVISHLLISNHLLINNHLLDSNTS